MRLIHLPYRHSMLTCNSNRLTIRTTTRAFFQVDMVPCVFPIWSRYLGSANLICVPDCTQIVNQTINLCECFSKGLHVTCCISQCSLGVYFTDSDACVIFKKPSRLLLLSSATVMASTFIFLRNVVFPKHVFSKQLSLCLRLEFPSIM